MVYTDGLCLGCMNDNGGEKQCSICGWNAENSNPDNALSLKFVVGNRYLLGRVMSANGEGFTYIGWDNLENTVVSVREYFPIGFAQRNPDKTVAMVKGAEYTFNEGLLEFIEINRKIMNSELPSLMDVYETFEENGTVYAVAKNVSGITLTEFLNKNGGTLKWEQARALFLPLIDTLSGMNEIGIIHGGISTDTIIVGRDGKLRISGYSIKKLRIANSELNTEIFDGFAAAEQYGMEGVSDTSSADVYGLAATLFRVLIGVAPAPAYERLQNDAISIPAKFTEELPRHVLSSLANGLQVLPKNRTKDIESFKNELVYGEVDMAIKTVNTTSEEKAKKQPKKSANSGKYVLISALITAIIFIALGAWLVFGVFYDDLRGKDKNDKPQQNQTQVTTPDIEDNSDSDDDVPSNVKYYEVPNCKNVAYSDLISNKDYEVFDFVISGQEFSNKPAGTVISQDVAVGEQVVKNTRIELVISIGPETVKMPSLMGYTPDEVEMALLKLGFVYDNIEIDTDTMFDPAQETGVVIKQEPEIGKDVSRFIKVKVYINGQVGQEDVY